MPSIGLNIAVSMIYEVKRERFPALAYVLLYIHTPDGDYTGSKVSFITKAAHPGHCDPVCVRYGGIAQPD